MPRLGRGLAVFVFAACTDVNRFNTYILAALFLAAGAVLYPGAAQAQAPTVSIAPASQTASEGGNAVFTVTVHGTTAMATTATYSITGVGISGSAQPQDIGAPGTTTPLERFLSGQEVRIEAGVDATAAITIPVLRDGRNEGAELFAVRLTGAEGGATALSGSGFAVVEISASADFILSLQGPASAVEGDTAAYHFFISGDAPSSTLQVPYEVAVGGGATPADLQILTPGAAPFGGAPAAATGYLAIAAGAATGTLLIRIADDNAVETAAESITVSVGGGPFLGNDGVFPVIGAARSVQTTLTDPSAGRVLLSAGPGAPVAEGATATFTVRVAGTTAGTTTATWVVSGFGANPASAPDFAGGAFPSGEITIAAGANPSATMELSILDDDSLPEGEETFQILLTGAAGGAAITPAVNSLLVGAIAADGVIIAGPSAEVAEGGVAVFTVTARGQTTQDTVVTWSAQPGASSPASANDFGNAANSEPLETFPVSRTITIAAGLNRTAEIRIPVFNDAGNEDAETFSVSLIGAAGGMTATGPPPRDTASAAIAESNDDFTFTFTGPSTVAEGDVAEYTLRLQGGYPLTQDLVATWIIDAATSPTTVDGNDYEVLAPAGFGGHGASNSNLAIAAGGDRAVVRLHFIADSVAEAATETLAVAVETAFQGNGGVFPLPASGVSARNPNRVGVDVVINDPPARRVILDTAPETPVAEGATATFAVRIPGASSATTVQYIVAGSGDNPAAAADFAGGVFPSGSVVIAEGTNSSATIAVPLAADFTTEERETFVLTLTGATAGSTEQPTLPANPSREASIAADAVGVFSLSGPAAPVAESANAAFVVRLSGAINGDAQVRYRVTGTAAGARPADFGDGQDSAFPEGVLTLAAGTDSSVNLAIPVHDDNLNEADEVFEVSLELVTAAAGGVTLRLASADGVAVVIDDNDPVLATLTAPAQPVNEGDNAIFSIELAGGARDADLTMAWQTTRTGTTNTAEAGDFGDRAAAAVFPAGTLTFAPGDSRMSAVVPVFRDFVTEGAETFVFELGRATGAAGEVPAATTATVTIAASGSQDRVFAASGPDSIAEGSTRMYSVVFESGAAVAAGGLTLNWAIEPRGAVTADADDFITSQTGSVTFAEGAAAGTSRSIAVAVADDALAEGRETFALVFAETVAGVRQAPVSSIRDDDEITVALSGGGATTESFSVSFTVTLGGSTRQNTAEIPWRVAADASTATANADAADYEPDSGFFTIEPGATTAMVSVAAVDDEVTERAEVFVLHLDDATRGAGVSRMLNSSQNATIAQSDPRQVVFERTGYLVSEAAPGATNTANPRLRFEPPGTAGEDVTVRLAPLSLGIPASMGVAAGSGDYRFFNAAGDTPLAAGAANTRVTLPAGETGAPAKIAIPHRNGYETTRTLGLVIDDALIGGTSASGLVTVGGASTTGIVIQEDDRVVVGILRAQHDFVEDTRSSPAFFFQVTNVGGSRFDGQPPLRIVFQGFLPETQRDRVAPSIPGLGSVFTRTYGLGSNIIATGFSIFDDNIGLEDHELFNVRILTPAEAGELGERQDPRIAANFSPVGMTNLAVLDNEFVRENRWAGATAPIRVSESQGTLNPDQTPRLSAPSVRDLEVHWATGAAPGAMFDAAEGSDYRLTTSTSIRQGVQVDTFAARVVNPPLILVDDDVAEEDETFQLSVIPGQEIMSFTSGIEFFRTTRTIIIEDDDDIRIDFEQAEYTLAEGAARMICVVVPGYSLNRTVTASVAVNNINAVRGADYTLTGDGRLADFTSSASEQRRCLDLRVLDDVVSEPDEVFTLSLQFDGSSGSRVASARPTATVTIDDETPVGFSSVVGNSFYADTPQMLTCDDCGDDSRMAYRLANPVVNGATFSFDAQARLTPPDGGVDSAFLAQTTFGIVHDDNVLNNCRAASAGLTAARENGFYAQTAMTAATGTTAWTFTAAGAEAYDAGDAAANRTRFGELTTDYRDLLRVQCDIADSATRTDVGIAAVGWSGLRTLVAGGRDRGHLAYAGNRFDDIATNGDPWAVEVNLYGDGRRVDLVMNEPLQGPVSSAAFAHAGGGISVTAAALAQASSRVIELTLSGDSVGGAVAVAAGQSVTAGDGATLAAGYHLAQLPAHDNAAPEMTSASFENNNTVRLAFSPGFNAAAVSTADFVLTVLNPGGVTGAEVVSLATDSNTTATLVVRTLGGVVQDGAARSPDGAERLQIRLARNFAGDITDNVADTEDHLAETHQIPSQALEFGDDLRPELLEFTAVNRTSASGGFVMNFRAGFSEPVNLQNGVRVLEVALAGANTGGQLASGVNVTATRQGAGAGSVTYTIALGPLTPAQYPPAGSGYTVELAAAAIADDAGNTLFPAEDRRATMGGHNSRGVFHTSQDLVAPTLVSAALDDANANLTLTFSEPVQFDAATGSSADIEITDSPGGWITTAALTSLPTIPAGGSTEVRFTIATQGPPPLNGASAEGRERARITLLTYTGSAGIRWQDATGNLLASGETADFTFNDNAAPAIAAVAGQTGSVAGGTTRRMIWTVTFTEPVAGVAANSFDIYTLASSTASVSDALSRGGADTFAGAEFQFTAGASTASYTIELAEPSGAPRYYLLATTDTNVITEAPPKTRALGGVVQTGPDGARGVLTLRDETPPRLAALPLVSTANTTITYRFDEDVRRAAATTEVLIALFNAGISTASAAPLAGDPAGYDRTAVLNDAISGIRVTGAVLEARELRLALEISGAAPLNGAVPVTATNYLQITFPAGAIEDIPAGGFDANSAATRTDFFTLYDTAAPRVVSAAPRGDAQENPDTTFSAAWTVVFTEPVSGVGSGDFVVCAVDAAGDACTDETAFQGTVMNAAAAVSREYIVSTSSLAQRIGASVFYRLQVDESAAIAARDAPGQGIEGLPFTGGAHEAPDSVAPALTDAFMDFPAGNRATATLVFNEAVAVLADFAARAQIAVTTSSEWITGATLAGAAVADGARLHIPLQTSGAAPVSGGSPDGAEAVTITLAAGAVADAVADANSAEYRRQLGFPENAPPQLRLRAPGALAPDFRRHRVMPDGGGTLTMSWRIRFTEAVAGVTTDSFTLLSAPEVGEDDDLDALAETLTSDAGVMNLATSATTYASFTAAPVTGAPAVVMTSGSVVYSDTWELTATGMAASNITTTTLAHYIVRFEQSEAVARIGDDEGRSFAGYAPPRPVWSEAQPAGDVNVPQVAADATVTAAPDNPTELLLEVTVEDALTTASAATFMNNFGVGDRNGAAAAPAGPFATVTGMELVRYSAATGVRVVVGEDETTLTFRARLMGTLDDGESAVGGERFRFTIPGGRLTDTFGNTQADDATFTAAVPESGAPEVAEFSVLSSVERAPNSGVFDLRYLLAFTEPVAVSGTALALYSSPGRNQPPPARAVATPIGDVLDGALVTAIMPSSLASSGSQARFVVGYSGVQRPAQGVRGYTVLLRAAGATESMAPMTKTLEDCPYYDSDQAMTGCLSASADVSDASPPRLRGAGYAGSRLWLGFDEPARALSGGAELADGDALQGFEVLPGHRMGQMTSGSVVVERALYRVSTQPGAARITGIELQLDTLIGGTDTAVWVRYTPPADGAGVYDNADMRGLNDAPNRIARVQELQVAEGLTDDGDGDGIADAAEIAAGGNPLAPLTDAERAALPQVMLGRGVSDIAYIAYSGIRAARADAAAHLGVATTGTAAAGLTAYYLSDTFGYTPAPGEAGYACGERFPANYRAPLARGGCAVVDFADIRAGVEHRIGWLAANAAGYWLPQATTSTLAEQRIVRVPELNMNAERLFFLAADADAATVTVAASHDGPAAAADLTLSFTTGQTQTGRKTFALTVAKSAVAASRSWGIAGLSGGGASLWHAGTDTAALTANSYSLGLATQTTVVRLGDDSLPPTIGSPVLFSGAGRGDADVRSVLSAGQFAVRLPVENPHPSLAPSVTATGAGAAALTALSAARSGADIEVALTLAAVTTPTSITLRISAPGRGTTATVTASWPVVASGHALAAIADGDSDGDGIADDNDLYEDDSGLPVAVLDADASLAGADSWHHIRPALLGQSVRLGASTLRRAAQREDLMTGAAPSYDVWSASFFDVEGFEVVYDFSVYGVDYSTQPAQGTTATTVAGGRAGVIIPLPQSLYGTANLSLFKYREDGAFEPFVASPGGNDYGFAPLANGACPDDTGAVGSLYRDDDGGLRRPKADGDACLAIYVVDGGEYDEDDARPNRVVHDPSGLRDPGGTTATGGSGSFGVAGLLMLLLGALCLLLRRRLPNTARAAAGRSK